MTSTFFDIDFFGVDSKNSGDAIVLQYYDGTTLQTHVVDGGYQQTGPDFVAHIRKNFYFKSINHVVATHADQDHAGGLVDVLQNFPVDNLWMLRPWMLPDDVLLDSFPTYNSIAHLRGHLRRKYKTFSELENIAHKLNIPIHDPLAGNKIGAFTVLSPTIDHYLAQLLSSEKTPKSISIPLALRGLAAQQPAKGLQLSRPTPEWGEEWFPNTETSPDNEMSVVQFGNILGHKILLTGDAGRTSLNAAHRFAVSNLIDVSNLGTFQVPHHGSRRNLNSEVLDLWLGKPGTMPVGHCRAIICNGLQDTDHPRDVVLRALYHRGAFIATTKDNGYINLRSTNLRSRSGLGELIPPKYPTTMER